tara:strand:+ start:8207 stop:8617 length:411 start_codon:yes stop_codon:yes gene_type:complete
MINVSIQIILSSNVKNPDPAINHQVGDVIANYLTSDISDVISLASRLVFIHIEDVPINDIKLFQFTAEPKVSDTPNAKGLVDIIHRHEWYFDFTKATAQELSDLASLRQITISWVRAKQTMVRRTGLSLIKETDLG